MLQRGMLREGRYLLERTMQSVQVWQRRLEPRPDIRSVSPAETSTGLSPPQLTPPASFRYAGHGKCGWIHSDARFRSTAFAMAALMR
jgi:hypothetical protein